MTGNAAPIAKGTSIEITLKDITNPPRMMKTPLFTIRVIEQFTNNTIQHSTAVPGLEILPGRMKLVSLQANDYNPYAAYIRDFTLRFRPKNGFLHARISTDFY